MSMGALVSKPASLRGAAAVRALRTSAFVTVAGLGAIVVGAAFLRGLGIAHQGLWYDEAMTARLVRETPGQLLGALPHTESTPPLYYLLAWGWVRVFGHTEAGLRSLSAVAGVAAVPVAFLAGRVLRSPRAGLLAAMLVAVNPLLVWYSQEARAYSLLVLLTALSFWLFARARINATPGRLLAWALLGAAALCTHYFAVFVVAPEALWLLALGRGRLRWRAVAVGIVGLAGAGLAGLAWTQRSHAHWQSVFGLGVRAKQLPTQLLAGFSPPATRTDIVVIGVAALACVLAAVVRGSSGERWAVAPPAIVAGTAILVPLAVAVVGIDYVNTRNAIGAIVPLAVALAICASSRRAGFVGLAAVAVMAAGSTAVVLEVPREAAAQRPAWRAVSAALAAPVSARRAILIRGSSSWALPLANYLPQTWWVGPNGARAKEIQVLRRLPARSRCWGRSWWGASCSMRWSPALGRSPARGFRFVSERRVGGFSITTYRAPRPIRLYERPPLESPRPAHAGQHRHKLLFSPVSVPLVP